MILVVTQPEDCAEYITNILEFIFVLCHIISSSRQLIYIFSATYRHDHVWWIRPNCCETWLTMLDSWHSSNDLRDPGFAHAITVAPVSPTRDMTYYYIILEWRAQLAISFINTKNNITTFKERSVRNDPAINCMKNIHL